MYNVKQKKISKTSFQTARFHFCTGPKSLFERVIFKFKDVSFLKPHGSHFNERLIERNAPVSEIVKFNLNSWRLVTVDVRTDTGKFVSTAWEFKANQKFWRVVIGFENTIQTIINIDRFSDYVGPKIVTSGELYDFVDNVNKKLMESENCN